MITSKIVNIYTRGKRIKGITRLLNKPEIHDIELSLPEIKLLLKEGHKIEEKYNDKTIILNLDNYNIEAKTILEVNEKNKITNTSNKDNSEEIKKLKEEISKLTSENNSIKNVSDTKINELKNSITEKDTTIANLNKKINELNTTISDLSKKVSDLSKESK